MRCPFCRVDKDRVVDSRAGDNAATIRRRRECLQCGRRFTTYERIEENPMRVIKKDGRRMPYDREKLRSGVQKACEKLPISAEQIDQAVAAVEAEAFEKFEREVPSNYLGELVMREMRKLHQVAYVRFASVYREFKDVSEFLSVLEEYVKGRAAAGSGDSLDVHAVPGRPAAEPLSTRTSGRHHPPKGEA
jgi:transcriptional repressor NrdR